MMIRIPTLHSTFGIFKRIYISDECLMFSKFLCSSIVIFSLLTSCIKRSREWMVRLEITLRLDFWKLYLLILLWYQLPIVWITLGIAYYIFEVFQPEFPSQSSLEAIQTKHTVADPVPFPKVILHHIEVAFVSSINSTALASIVFFHFGSLWT